MPGLTWLFVALCLLVACDGPPDPQVIATYPTDADRWAAPANDVYSPCPWQPTSLPPTWRDRWNPADTFWEAFAVFMSIFQVLADILIWSVVVAGPFVLMGLGIRSLVRYMRRRADAEE